MADPITVLFEDRPAALVAVKIAALSLLRHNPSTPLLIWVPSASEGFQSWARERVPQAEVRLTRRGVEGTGYETKPSVLLQLLSEGHDQVVWFDTDMVVTGDLDARLEQIPAEHIGRSRGVLLGSSPGQCGPHSRFRHARWADLQSNSQSLPVARQPTAPPTARQLATSREQSRVPRKSLQLDASDPSVQRRGGTDGTAGSQAMVTH